MKPKPPTPFPLSDIQEAYWVGRTHTFELGGVTTHFYCELDCKDVNLDRLDSAWRQLVERHEALRSNVTADGRQYVTENPPDLGIRILDLRGEPSAVVDAQLKARRDRFSHELRSVDACPAMRVRVTRITDHRLRLHLSTDALFVDARSRALLFAEWKMLYQGESALPEPQTFFRTYIHDKQLQREQSGYLSALKYWGSKIETLPQAPDLPLAKNPALIGRPRFERHESLIDAGTWSRLERQAEAHALRPSVLLLAVFTEVLRAWSRTQRFTVNLTLIDRLAQKPAFETVVGDFTSSMLLAVESGADQTLVERFSRLQRDLREDLRHSAMSGVEVIRKHARRRPGKHTPLMPVVFSSFLSMKPHLQDTFVPTWLGTPVYEITQTPQVWLDMQVRTKAGSVYLVWDVVEGLFPDGMVRDMFGALLRLLSALAGDDAPWSESWPTTLRRLIPVAQIKQRATYNATHSSFALDGLHGSFFEQASRRPSHAAVIAQDRVLTYGELEAGTLRLAHILQSLQARPGTLVAIVMRKGWEQAVAVLGVLAAGAAYLPVDPDLPAERVRLLLEDGCVNIALTQTQIIEQIDWPQRIQRIAVDQIDTSTSAFSPRQVRAHDLAYVIYTSGTTGRPKGVMIGHSAALNTVLDINRRFGIGPDDRVLALSALSFDLSVYDFIGILAAGGTVILPTAEQCGEPAHWAELIRRYNVTIWNSVPTLMLLLVEYMRQHRELSASSLRLALLSGDWIPVGLPDGIRAEFPQAEVVSLGGATEASIWSIHYPVSQVDPAWRSVPYGKPLSNQRVYVLNEALEPCPDWVAGELYIAGEGLAQGYWQDPVLTDERFVVHRATGERLYRTGDIGRFLPGGNIEFLGREDTQVKVQGFRIELGEIESTLAQHPAVSACVVTVHGSAETSRRLIAHVLLRGFTGPTAPELRQYLEARLPSYMVPSAFHFMDSLPTGPTGKVDRKALGSVEPAVETITEHSGADRTVSVCTLVAEVAEVQGVTREANLLALGLTSVDIIRIANRVETEFGVRPPLGEFYRNPSVKFLEELIEKRGVAATNTDEAGQLHCTQLSRTRSQLLLDPSEREAFKNSLPGTRRFDAEMPTIPLRSALPDDERHRRYASRRSCRRFCAGPLPLKALGGLLDLLRPIPVNGGTKRRYGSAGGLYPIQIYLYVHEGRVEGLRAGAYYHDPQTHRLLVLNDGGCIDVSAYDPFVNGPLFDAAAFALFLVADLDAIAPLYGDRSIHYATIEAGLICQLLETEGPSFGIGLCQIGHVEEIALRRALLLEDRHLPVHSLLGGATDAWDSWGPFTESYAVTQADEEEEGEI